MNERKNFDCLLPKTRLLLEELIDTAPFLHHYTFVGGSALALHMCHRKSEDLDFFTYKEGSFNKNEIRKYIGKFEQKEILNESDEQIDLLINGVKVTFFDASWQFLAPVKEESFNLASLEAVAAMKVNVLFLRAKYRDYYDLYFLAKVLSLRQIFDLSKEVVEGLTYKLFCVSLLYIDDIADDNIDHLEPKENVNKKQIQEFFEKRMKK
jgi:predicted nucleotidyltransferase component of viral defense system